MRLILVELNEVNFDIIRRYISKGEKLPGFKKILKGNFILTKSEIKYDLLEPWIQWASVHTGKTFDEHKIFRLGDSVNSKIPQIFEKIENEGYSVGAISPMNTRNELKNSRYFIPDPWTKTSTDGKYLSNSINNAISQAVNDNSESKLTIKTVINLSIACVILINPTKLLKLFIYALRAFDKPWRKAIFLDKLLFQIHLRLFKSKKPDFSTLFLNGCAHIQHHYFFNSQAISDKHPKNPSWYIASNKDPLLEVIKSYDEMIEELLSIKNSELIIATGLSQKPYDKLKFYYRLRDHENFLNLLGINFLKVIPRMTRDFLILFKGNEEAKKAQKILNSITMNDKIKMFNHIDNRGNELFVTLSYPNEVLHKSFIFVADKKIHIEPHVVFVAIKNGMHDEKGYAYFSDGIFKYSPKDNSHVLNIHSTILNFFKISTKKYI